VKTQITFALDRDDDPRELHKIAAYSDSLIALNAIAELARTNINDGVELKGEEIMSIINAYISIDLLY
jgi:hypothetical protein